MRINAFATTTALACVLLAGCTDDPVGPVDGDTSAPTTSVSPTPIGPTPPPLPDAAKADTTAGAVAFVEHYIELLNYAANTGDVAPLRAVATDCEGCDTYSNFYEKTYADGGYLKDDGWKPVAPFAEQSGSDMIVVTEVDAPPVTYVPSPGAEPEVGRQSKYNLRFVLRAADGNWTVAALSGGGT